MFQWFYPKKRMFLLHPVWPERVATEQKGRIMYSHGCRHSSYLEIRERKRGEICWQRVQDTLVTNLSSELQHLAEKHGVTASYTTTHKMIQSLIVGGFSDHPAISPAWQRLCHTQVLRELSVRCTMDTKHIRDKVCFQVTEKLPVCGYEYGGGRVCTQIFARSWKNVMCLISGHCEN